MGKGIAVALGEAGATVYITGRTVDEKQVMVPLAGSIHDTAAAVTEAGGRGIAVQCDHRDDAQVWGVIEQIEREQGRLDILVNNAWGGYEGYATGAYPPPSVPFWERPISFWDENMDGVRWTYVTSVYAVPLIVRQPHSLIVNISFSPLTPGNPAYNAAKTAVDRMTFDMAARLREHETAVIALHPGLVRTEIVLKDAQWFDMSNSESPQFTGRAVCALFSDPAVMEKSGKSFIVARLAQEYDFDDVDGKRPTPMEG